MKGKKKEDLAPFVAIGIFLGIVVIVCALRLGTKGRQEGGAPSELAPGTLEAGREGSLEETSAYGSLEETSAYLVVDETEEFGSILDKNGETESGLVGNGAQPADADGKGQSSGGIDGRGGGSGENAAGRKVENRAQISGNNVISRENPFSGEEGVRKTNGEMLAEMSSYWEERNMEAVEDLSMLPWYRHMSADLSEGSYLYSGEQDASGQPSGKGIAVYPDNEYYYGDWVAGERQGYGEWFKKYVYYDDDVSADRTYLVHMYMGEWSGDLPNGEGQEHYDLDMSNAPAEKRYVQNVIGTFTDGLYDGEMYLTTLSREETFVETIGEWNGWAENGVWEACAADDSPDQIPVCVNISDSEEYLWLTEWENRDRGILGLVEKEWGGA